MAVNLEYASQFLGLLVGLLALLAIPMGQRRFHLPPGQAALTWGLAVTAVYWVLGPYSLLGNLRDEMYQGVPTAVFLAKHWSWPNFAHSLQGGSDPVSQWAQPPFLIHLWALKHLPIWVALALLKVTVWGVAWAGVYVLALRLVPGQRALAVAAGALVTFSHILFFEVSTLQFLSYAGLPGLAAVLTNTQGTWRRHALAVAAAAALYAFGAYVHNSLHLFVFLCVALALLLGAFGWRLIWSIGLTLAIVAAVHAPSLYALLKFSAVSPRVELARLFSRAGFMETLGLHSTEVVALAALAVVGLLSSPSIKNWRILGVLALTALAGPLGNIVPWAALGLPLLGGLNYAYLNPAFAVVAILAAAQAAAVLRDRLKDHVIWRIPATVFPLALLWAIAIGQLGQSTFKVLFYGIGLGGATSVAAIPNLAERPWETGRIRVVTVPYRLFSQTALAYGLHTFDGYGGLEANGRSLFWRHGLGNPDREALLGRASLGKWDMDWQCCAPYEVDSFADARLLQMANVGYIVSYRPLQGAGVQQVSGPAEEVVGRRDAPIAQKVRTYVGALFAPPPVFVYRLPEPLPRLYFASRRVVTALSPRDAEYYPLLRQWGPQRAAVLSEADGSGDAPSPVARVVEWHETPLGVDVEVDAPEGGLLLFNQAHTPFWTCRIDGLPTNPVPANAVHMAVEVPAGARHVSFPFNRPSLW